MNDAREKGRGGLTIPGGPGLVSAALVFEAILDSKTGSAALEHLARLPRTEPLSIEIPVRFVALQEVMNELLRQDAKWGEQNHPDGTGGRFPFRLDGETYGHIADLLKESNDADVSAESLTWTGILLEEVFEALAEQPFSVGLRTELVQVAAVAVQWVLAIDRQAAALTEAERDAPAEA